MKISQIAEALGAKIENASPDADISGVAGIEHAVPGQLTFVSNPKYAHAAKTTCASAVIVDENFPAISTGMLRTKNPYLAWARAIELFYQPPQYAPGIHPTAVVHPSATLGPGAHLGPYVTIDADARIGNHAVLLAHVAIYRGAQIGHNFFAHTHAVVREFCQIGDNVILQNGAIVGSDGFGFAKTTAEDKAEADKTEGGKTEGDKTEGDKTEKPRWHKILQSGNVIIASDVEIQANSCIDRAAVGHTTISRGAKIDNLVQVGHASTVGEDTLLCAQVGLAGSTEVGNNVILAGQVGVAGHCKIGDNAIATAQSGIPNDVEPGKTVSGYPAIDNKLWLRCSAVFNKLPDLAKAIRKLSDQNQQNHK
ncbi:MAG: UDP-3-O-(3-hydroxymyristoyl)glucosamine N-acyltransferase [Terriglobales bacterium]|jgi:UDP-3-O-[3-hydroxymyristoyl] glucosamine N-acyltransferase